MDGIFHSQFQGVEVTIIATPNRATTKFRTRLNFENRRKTRCSQSRTKTEVRTHRPRALC